LVTYSDAPEAIDFARSPFMAFAVTMTSINTSAMSSSRSRISIPCRPSSAGG
jgi:hypothetical protein